MLEQDHKGGCSGWNLPGQLFDILGGQQAPQVTGDIPVRSGGLFDQLVHFLRCYGAIGGFCDQDQVNYKDLTGLLDRVQCRNQRRSELLVFCADYYILERAYVYTVFLSESIR